MTIAPPRHHLRWQRKTWRVIHRVHGHGEKVGRGQPARVRGTHADLAGPARVWRKHQQQVRSIRDANRYQSGIRVPHHRIQQIRRRRLGITEIQGEVEEVVRHILVHGQIGQRITHRGRLVWQNAWREGEAVNHAAGRRVGVAALGGGAVKRPVRQHQSALRIGAVGGNRAHRKFVEVGVTRAVRIQLEQGSHAILAAEGRRPDQHVALKQDRCKGNGCLGCVWVEVPQLRESGAVGVDFENRAAAVDPAIGRRAIKGAAGKRQGGGRRGPISVVEIGEGIVAGAVGVDLENHADPVEGRSATGRHAVKRIPREGQGRHRRAPLAAGGSLEIHEHLVIAAIGVHLKHRAVAGGTAILCRAVKPVSGENQPGGRSVAIGGRGVIEAVEHLEMSAIRIHLEQRAATVRTEGRCGAVKGPAGKDQVAQRNSAGVNVIGGEIHEHLIAGAIGVDLEKGAVIGNAVPGSGAVQHPVGQNHPSHRLRGRQYVGVGETLQHVESLGRGCQHNQTKNHRQNYPLFHNSIIISTPPSLRR